MKPGFVFLFFLTIASALAQPSTNFDGRPWNISTGNLSVGYIQASPVGAYPRTGVLETPPSVDAMAHLKSEGLVANEDYIAWGAVEQEPGQWSWKEHDAMEQTLHKAGLKYVAYNWLHFPPVWLRDQQKDKRTLMRCLEHNEECNYLSIFDPRTVNDYDHFYKNLHEHFGNRVDDVYACILGPYGEGNYPLKVPDWVNMGHCHEGYWCGDTYAISAFRSVMKHKYSRIHNLNQAWNVNYKSFDDISMPRELADEKFQPSPEAFSTPQDKRRWLDFITWYHQAIIDFAEKSVQTVLKYFPADKVRIKPGGNAGGVNPIAWGTYCPGYGKMAAHYPIVIQPADCGGAVFGDKWMGTAYQFYGVKECTEPAGDLDDKGFVRRMFSDASCGASQVFTYQFDRHIAALQKYVHLITGKPGETEIAVYCPTTLYRLGASLQPSIQAAVPLRDLCEFDVLDELLITDGALKTKHYKAIILFQGNIIDKPILDKIDAFQRAGGKVIMVGDFQINDVEARAWSGATRAARITAVAKDKVWLNQLSLLINGCKGVDGKLDGLWTCHRKNQMIVFNSTAKPVATQLAGQSIEVAPYTIRDLETKTP